VFLLDVVRWIRRIRVDEVTEPVLAIEILYRRGYQQRARGTSVHGYLKEKRRGSIT
jgi:hypothetical protein